MNPALRVSRAVACALLMLAGAGRAAAAKSCGDIPWGPGWTPHWQEIFNGVSWTPLLLAAAGAALTRHEPAHPPPAPGRVRHPAGKPAAEMVAFKKS